MCETPNMQDDLVGSVEASRIAGIPYATFMRWVAQGVVEPVHVNPGPTGAKVFRRADILKLAAGDRGGVRKYTRKAEAAS